MRRRLLFDHHYFFLFDLSTRVPSLEGHSVSSTCIIFITFVYCFVSHVLVLPHFICLLLHTVSTRVVISVATAGIARNCCSSPTSHGPPARRGPRCRGRRVLDLPRRVEFFFKTRTRTRQLPNSTSSRVFFTF